MAPIGAITFSDNSASPFMRIFWRALQTLGVFLLFTRSNLLIVIGMQEDGINQWKPLQNGLRLCGHQFQVAIGKLTCLNHCPAAKWNHVT